METLYKGYRFRSRLEARWAVFLDKLRVPYEYEPEGFNLGEAGCYLPDFRIKCYGYRGDCLMEHEPTELYIEVKGHMTEEDAKKIEAFSEEHPVLVVGNIPGKDCSTDSFEVGAYDGMDGTFIYPFNYETIDGDYFAAYPAADKYGHFYLFGDDSNYINEDDRELVEKAYATARQARFEHGEMPGART